MHKLTTAQLSEPPVILVIPEPRFWRLPADIRDTLNLYGVVMQRGNVYVTVPAYRYRQWTHLLPTSGN